MCKIFNWISPRFLILAVNIFLRLSSEIENAETGEQPPVN